MTENTGPRVDLISAPDNPYKSLYLAYRVCYSDKEPYEILEEIDENKITYEDMFKFVERMFKTGHGSPLEQVYFEFTISGVSRAFSHQFVRHRVGINFEQQSQRYVKMVSFMEKNFFDYVIPKTIGTSRKATETYFGIMEKIADAYQTLIDEGMPPEDARFVLPNATTTNFKITINLRELLHIGDLRLCTRAQWEFRRVVALMRAEIHKQYPLLASIIQPKCGEHRMGTCDETLKDYKACPISVSRPHKSMIEKSWAKSLNEDDFITILNS